ncbi:MAG: DUF58 domain-containing protein [Deltaproteobacteria bacterium]|nr:DUF58 domain-containing protein [Deltaproteobacteria bacterium]
MPEGVVSDAPLRNDLLTTAGIDAAVLAEIESLMLAARQAATGALVGMHRSLRRGSSSEFSEHKLYTPGDDILHIDWHAYAKTDRYHVKQFEDETNLVLEVLVDHSGSMEFATSGLPTKLTTARILAAALTYLALRQGDAAGRVSYADGVTDELPARATGTHWMEVLMRLVRLTPQGRTGIGRAIDRFAQQDRRRAITVVISDLFDPDPDLMQAFRRLSARRHDVAVLHIMDPEEIDFPYENPSIFASMEDERKLFIHPRTLRHAFVTEMQRFLSDTARVMAEIGVDYHLLSTRDPPAHMLGTFLRSRERR